MGTFAVLFAFFVALAYSESCACVAEEEDFTINCNQDLTSYFEYLEDNNCQDDCDQNCQRNFYIVQSHHDYCLSGEIPTELEQELHEFEDSCNSCEISRRYDSSLTTCPSVDCDDDSDAMDAFDVLEGECIASCDSDRCGSAFQILRAYHDGCDNNDIEEELEEALHSFEDLCAAQDCNVVNDSNQLVCESDDDDNNDDDSSSASILAASVFGLIALFI